MKQNATGVELQRFDYSYGQVNQANGSVDTTKNNGQIGRIDGTINAVKQWDQRFVYDPLSRLSTAAEYRGDNGAQTYQAHYDYDRYGNRFQYQNNVNLGYTPVQPSDFDQTSNRNRFISSGATPTTYDSAGNILSDAKFRSLSYAYDANNRQTSASGGGINQTSIYDCAGQRVRTTAGGTTRTMVYDIFGQEVADYTGSSGSTLERENIYRGGQLLATSETLGAAAPSGLATAPTSTNIALSWSAASGATNYRVERKGAGGSYGLLGTTASTSMSDSGVSSGSAYLYKVCAADGAGNCTSSYSNVVLGAPLNFTTDPTIRTITDDSTGATVTTMKAAHITQLRTAVNAVRSLAGLSNAGWTHPAATGDIIYADDVRDLRTALDQALTALGIQTSSYSETLAGVPNGTTIKGVHITELRQRATSGSGTAGSGGSSGGLKYVLTDVQGSTRAVMNNNGVGTSAIIARHDYLPFGEEILSGTGLRTGTQGYGAGDTNRKKYGLTERDEATGLDHTWWRKYESRAGRWTSPDPLAGSISDPQSFNRYAYTQNDPVNYMDPSGLYLDDIFEQWWSWGWGDRLGDLPGYGSRIGENTRYQEWRHDLIITLGFDPSFPNRLESDPQGGKFGATPSEKYKKCKSKLAKGVPAPEMERARVISQAARDEGIAPELLAVTVSVEDGNWFAGGDSINGPHGGGTADVGPGQLDYGRLQNWSGLNGLANVWGTNTGVGQTFNGNESSNLRASARYIQDLGGGREGTIHYHSGRGPFSRKPAGQAAIRARAREYDARAKSYEDFFKCVRSSLAF